MVCVPQGWGTPTAPRADNELVQMRSVLLKLVGSGWWPQSCHPQEGGSKVQGGTKEGGGWVEVAPAQALGGQRGRGKGRIVSGRWPAALSQEDTGLLGLGRYRVEHCPHRLGEDILDTLLVER